MCFNGSTYQLINGSTSFTGLLESAERRLAGDGVVAVDPDGTGLNSLGEHQGLVDVPEKFERLTGATRIFHIHFSKQSWIIHFLLSMVVRERRD